MKLVRCLVALLLGVPLDAAPVPKELEKRPSLVGVWWLARCNETVHEDPATSLRYTFRKDGSAGTQENAGAESFEYTYTADPSAMPPTLAMKYAGGNGGAGQFLAVYRLDSDSLRMVVCDASNPKPTEVVARDNELCYDFKRMK